MKAWQVILLGLIFAIGLGAGLFYGWMIDPVTYVNTTAASLRIDYKTDVVLMVADIYFQDADVNSAITRLSWLEGVDQVSLVDECLEYAASMNFSEQDLARITSLLDGLRWHQATRSQQQ